MFAFSVDCLRLVCASAMCSVLCWLVPPVPLHFLLLCDGLIVAPSHRTDHSALLTDIGHAFNNTHALQSKQGSRRNILVSLATPIIA